MSETLTKKAPKKVSKVEDLKNVKPLRTKEEINDFKWALSKCGTSRDVFLFNLGINVGLRISDIVDLKVHQIRNREETKVVEKKTGKQRTVIFGDTLMDYIKEYTRGMDDDDWLFPSRKGDRCISTTQAYRVLQKAAVMLGRDDIGTHTLRKTFGYHHYQAYKDIAVLQDMFNHSKPSTTLIYIGITQDEIRKTMRGFGL